MPIEHIVSTYKYSFLYAFSTITVNCLCSTQYIDGKLLAAATQGSSLY